MCHSVAIREQKIPCGWDVGRREIKRESTRVPAHASHLFLFGCVNTELLVISWWIGCQTASRIYAFATFFFPGDATVVLEQVWMPHGRFSAAKRNLVLMTCSRGSKCKKQPECTHMLHTYLHLHVWHDNFCFRRSWISKTGNRYFRISVSSQNWSAVMG